MKRMNFRLLAARGLSVCLVPAVAACSILPGLHVSVPQKPGREPTYNFMPITLDLVMQQKAAGAARAEAAADDGLTSLARGGSAYRYRIGPGDVISVIVWDHPELTIPAGQFATPESSGRLVSQDGTMYYPNVGVFRVAGMTTEEVRQHIAENLARVITRPQVDVRIAAFRSQRIQVTGEVARPGPVPLTDVPVGVLDVLAQAGGLTERASRLNAALTREGQTHAVDLDALLRGGDPDANVLLRGGDVLHVRDNTREAVFLLGEFNKETPLPMQRGHMSLTEAISAAGGLSKVTANRSALYVFRDNGAPSADEPWKPDVYALDLSSAQALLLADQFELKPRDVVYVAATSFAKYNSVINQLLPTISSVFQINALVDSAEGNN